MNASHPSSSYVWKNTAGAVVAAGRQLRLHKVNDSSGGNYICIATNKLGSDDRSIIVLVRSKLFFSFLYFFNLLTACMPFQETSKEKGQKHIGRKPFAFDMCRLVQTIQQKLCFEFFLHSERANQKGEVKPTLPTWLQIKIKIMPEITVPS